MAEAEIGRRVAVFETTKKIEPEKNPGEGEEKRALADAGEGGEGGEGGGEGEGAEKRANGHDGEGETEARARRLGWRPESEYKGRGDWLPADKFIEKVETEAPVRNERLRFLEGELAKRDRRDGERDALISEQGEALKELLGRSRSAEQRGYDRAKAEIEEAKLAAVKSADPAAYSDAVRKEQELEKTRPAAEPEKREPEKKVQQQPQISQAVLRFGEDNKKWFHAESPDFDKDASDDMIAFFAVNQQRGMSDEANLAACQKKMKQLHPHLFENPRRKEPGAVHEPSGGGRNGSAGKKVKTVADLPEDAKEQLGKLKRLIPGYTDKDYLEEYQWER